MKPRLYPLLGVVLYLFSTATFTAAARVAPALPAKLNVVLILVDNFGWGELGVYGGGELRGAPTPRLDRLSAEGLLLTNFNTICFFPLASTQLDQRLRWATVVGSGALLGTGFPV